MNIEDKRCEKNTIYFSEVKVGKPFQFCKDIYMKVEPITGVDTFKSINAIDILNGTGHFFLPDSTVLLLNAKVVIF